MESANQKVDELYDVIREAGLAREAVGQRDLDFKDLMRFRVNQILLVASRYDFYTMIEDGQLTEAILSEYQDLNLLYAPSITRVFSGESALQAIRDQHYDLVITMRRLGDMRAEDFCAAAKKHDPSIRVTLLGYQSRELQTLLLQGAMQRFDGVYIWSGNRKLFLAIIKLLEDLRNAAADCLESRVRAILLVEDSPTFYSFYLPMIYTELIIQGQSLIPEGKNIAEKLVRQRARPKILHARNYEEAKSFFLKYQHQLLGIITDVKFPVNGLLEGEAGLRFTAEVRALMPELPILVQTSKDSHRQSAEALKVAFANKNSKTLLHEVRDFMQANFGFGDFVFRDPELREVGRARTIPGLRDELRRVPDSSLLYHASRNHFSHWLMARTRFRLANEFRELSVSDFKDIDDLRQWIIRRLDDLTLSESRGIVSDFAREERSQSATFLRIGGGSLGGKARGLAFIDTILKNYLRPEFFPGVEIKIPQTIVLCTDLFGQFLESNRLMTDCVLKDLSDAELVKRFLNARLPMNVEQDLRAVVDRLRAPLAIRSSSLLEDTLYQPFAGIYATVMIPNSNPSLEVRFQELVQAIKYVYVSTYLSDARNYLEATGHRLEEEAMAVIIQQLAGRPYGRFFYPHYSGVARSYNYYPFGDARPTDGVVSLAMGLGKTIVDGGTTAQFCPSYPAIMPQFNTVADYYSNSQRHLYALDLEARPLEYAPSEDGNLVHLELREAETHGTLASLASTYSRENDMLFEGTFRKGTRVLNFAPILQSGVVPLAGLLKLLMRLCERAMSCPVEIEFAGTVGERSAVSEFHFLQVRPMVKEEGTVDLQLDQVPSERILLKGRQALGNGVAQVHDVVFVKHGTFEAARTREIQTHIAAINAGLEAERRPYLLLGPGRWGSSDPWLGIPVRFTEIAGARAIVETSLPNLVPTPSQGSHFFQNLTSFRIFYFTLRHYRAEDAVDWEWLEALPRVTDGEWVVHARTDTPLEIRVDGQTGDGAVIRM